MVSKGFEQADLNARSGVNLSVFGFGVLLPAAITCATHLADCYTLPGHSLPGTPYPCIFLVCTHVCIYR